MGNGRAISATLAAAIVAIVVWAVKLAFGLEIPPDIKDALIVILTGVSTSAAVPAVFKRKEPTP